MMNWPNKIDIRRRQRLIQDVSKEPTTISTAVKMIHVLIRDHDSNKKKESWQTRHLSDGFYTRTTAVQKKPKDSSAIC